MFAQDVVNGSRNVAIISLNLSIVSPQRPYHQAMVSSSFPILRHKQHAAIITNSWNEKREFCHYFHNGEPA
jgi:hypothetical protein